MIKMKFRKLKEKTKKIWIKASAMATSVGIIIMTSSTRALADTGGASSITTQDASTVASRIFKANQGIAEAFGGALIGIAVVVIGIKMLMASKKQEARSEAMDSVLTVIIAALLIGGFAVFAGLFWTMGQ